MYELFCKYSITHTLETFLKPLSIFSKGICFEKIDKNFLYEYKHACGKFEERKSRKCQVYCTIFIQTVR